jgi:hypothetical protein
MITSAILLDHNVSSRPFRERVPLIEEEGV